MITNSFWFLVVAHLVGMRGSLIVVSICVSLIISYIVHLFMCLLAIKEHFYH